MPATSWRAVGGKRLAFGAGALRGGGVSTPRRLPGGPGVLSPWSPRLAKPASNDFDSCIGLPFWGVSCATACLRVHRRAWVRSRGTRNRRPGRTSRARAWHDRLRAGAVGLHRMADSSMFARVIARHSEGARLARIRECAECARPVRIMSGTGGCRAGPPRPGRRAALAERRAAGRGLEAGDWTRSKGESKWEGIKGRRGKG